MLTSTRSFSLRNWLNQINTLKHQKPAITHLTFGRDAKANDNSNIRSLILEEPRYTVVVWGFLTTFIPYWKSVNPRYFGELEKVTETYSGF